MEISIDTLWQRISETFIKKVGCDIISKDHCWHRLSNLLYELHKEIISRTFGT